MDFTINELRQLLKYCSNDRNITRVNTDHFKFVAKLMDKLRSKLKNLNILTQKSNKENPDTAVDKLADKHAKEMWGDPASTHQREYAEYSFKEGYNAHKRECPKCNKPMSATFNGGKFSYFCCPHCTTFFGEIKSPLDNPVVIEKLKGLPLNITALLPKKSDMNNKISDAKKHQTKEHPEFIKGYELGYHHCYNWISRILSLFVI